MTNEQIGIATSMAIVIRVANMGFRRAIADDMQVLTYIAEPGIPKDSVGIPDHSVDEQVQASNRNPDHVGACPDIVRWNL